MHPVVLLLAGGGTFFAGLALLLAAALVRRHATPRANRVAAWLAILAVGALATSATPLPPWAYVSLALPLALLPVATADGGADQSVGEGGGAPPRPGAHDERFMHGDGPNEESAEGILAFLRSDLAKQAPFFMVASLVNPHDVPDYPTNFEAFGYTEDWLEGEIDLPSTAAGDLSTKPSAQRQFLALSAGLGPLPTPQMKRNYLNFHGNLLELSDRHIREILDTLEREGLMADTLIIRTADHGEMGMTHGGMRQKNFNFYEESLRVPLVYSDPLLHPEARSNEAIRARTTGW